MLWGKNIQKEILYEQIRSAKQQKQIQNEENTLNWLKCTGLEIVSGFRTKNVIRSTINLKIDVRVHITKSTMVK